MNTIRDYEISRRIERGTAMLLGVILAIGAASPASAQIDFHWQGDTSNNHWDNTDNTGNWAQDPGAGLVPDAAAHSVFFTDSADRFNLDLIDHTRDVGEFVISTTGANHACRFLKGTLRFNGNVSITTPGLETPLTRTFPSGRCRPASGETRAA